jgi:hypothetical protein
LVDSLVIFRPVNYGGAFGVQTSVCLFYRFSTFGFFLVGVLGAKILAFAGRILGTQGGNHLRDTMKIAALTRPEIHNRPEGKPINRFRGRVQTVGEDM